MLNSGRFWYTLAQKQGILTVKWSVTPATFSLAAMVKKKSLRKHKQRIYNNGKLW